MEMCSPFFGFLVSTFSFFGLVFLAGDFAFGAGGTLGFFSLGAKIGQKYIRLL